LFGATRCRWCRCHRRYGARVDDSQVLDLFDLVVRDVQVALAGVEDWGFSGTKESQYHHDVAADEAAISRLLDAGVGVLSEETGLHEPDREVIVVVDPVDGSTNASHGLPWYATSLCAVRDGELAASLVVNLATGTTYRARRGAGATRDGHTISSRGRSPGVTQLSDAIIACSGLPGSQVRWRQFRVLGACALDMCAVADGSLDAYFDSGDAHGVWDYLGATLVCQEAGLLPIDVFDRDLLVLDPKARRAPLVAATAELTAEVLDLRRSF